MTTSRTLIGGLAALTMLAASHAGAQTLDSGKAPDGAADPSRYQMRPAGDGFVRMDRETGEMSYCSLRGDRLVCKLAAEDRDAYEREIARLEDRLKALESENGPESGTLPEARSKLDRKLDEAMQYADKALRRFFGMIEDLRAENGEKSKI